MKISKVVFLDSVEDPRIRVGSSLDKSRSTFVADATLTISTDGVLFCLLAADGPVVVVPAAQVRFAVPALIEEITVVESKRGPGRPRREAAKEAS